MYNKRQTNICHKTKFTQVILKINLIKHSVVIFNMRMTFFNAMNGPTQRHRDVLDHAHEYLKEITSIGGEIRLSFHLSIEAHPIRGTLDLKGFSH